MMPNNQRSIGNDQIKNLFSKFKFTKTNQDIIIYQSWTLTNKKGNQFKKYCKLPKLWLVISLSASKGKLKIKIWKGLFSGITNLQLIEKLLITTKEKIRESNFAYTPPSPVSFLIGAFPALRSVIDLYRRAKKVTQQSEAFISQMQLFGLNVLSIKTLQKEGIHKFCQLKRLTISSMQLDRVLLRTVNLPIGQILLLEDFIQWVSCKQEYNDYDRGKKYLRELEGAKSTKYI